ncbi:MAG: hypothetical protein M3348_13315 [Acidobacteriota bacterium]|nr:hypothetical protein [Acidobacteriota bacterium]
MSSRSQLLRKLRPDFAPFLTLNKVRERDEGVKAVRRAHQRTGRYQTKDGRKYEVIYDGSVRVLNKPISRRKKQILGLI